MDNVISTPHGLLYSVAVVLVWCPTKLIVYQIMKM